MLSNMIKVTTKPSTYGPKKVIEGYKGFSRLYVHKTNLKTFVVSHSEHLSLDNMVLINNEYHFSTYKQLNTALNA